MSLTKVTTSMMDTTTLDAEINSIVPGRNKILGGDFTTNPWQRGVTFTNPADGAYTADRWQVIRSDDAAVDVKKTADAPTAAQAGIYTANCLHADVTTADASIGAAQTYCLLQKIEGLNAAMLGFGQAGTRYVTLSFWVKATKTGVYCVSVMNSAQNRSYVAEYTVSASNTWEKKTITIPADTTGTWLYDTGVGIRLYFPLAAGANFLTTAGAWAAGLYLGTTNSVNGLDSTANDFKLALVQLELGSGASQFEGRMAGQELELCQRYYQDYTEQTFLIHGTGYSTSVGFSTIFPLPVSMRIAPTPTNTSGTDGGSQTALAITAGKNALRINLDPSPNPSGGSQRYYSWKMTLSAEL